MKTAAQPLAAAERRRLHGILDAAESRLRAGKSAGLCGALSHTDLNFVLRNALVESCSPNPEDPFASENYWWPAPKWSYPEETYPHRHRTLMPRLIALDLLRLWVDGELTLDGVPNFRPVRRRKAARRAAR